jgi:hypothetical protein
VKLVSAAMVVSTVGCRFVQRALWFTGGKRQSTGGVVVGADIPRCKEIRSLTPQA